MDILLALVVLLALILPFWFLGLRTWAYFLLALAVFVGLCEGVSVLVTRRSLSQKFWDYNKTHPVQKWVLLTILAVTWAGLLVHLAWK